MAVNGPIPFADSFYWWLKRYNFDLKQLASASRRYEQPYLAWEIVRRNRNPYFMTGTGFEGYYIGVGHSTEAVLDSIIRINQEVLTRIMRAYRMDYGFKSRLMKTLTGEMSDPKAIGIWSSALGAMVARLRCNLRHNAEADRFRVETYQITQSLPNIVYTENTHQILHRYSVGAAASKIKSSIDMASLHPQDQDAWLVAWSIGRFGHPLVRQYLEYTYGFLPRPYF